METKAERIAKLRVQAGFATRPALVAALAARGIQVTRQAIGKWETDPSLDIRNETLVVLAELFGCDVAYLVGGDPSAVQRSAAAELIAQPFMVKLTDRDVRVLTLFRALDGDQALEDKALAYLEGIVAGKRAG